jgi:hypothetical protein
VLGWVHVGPNLCALGGLWTSGQMTIYAATLGSGGLEQGQGRLEGRSGIGFPLGFG